MSEQHELILTIDHPSGLHLRPAALFVKTAASFQSTIRIANLDREGQPESDAKSMFGVMQQAVSQGHRVRVRAEGPDADAALSSLQQLVDQRFEAEE
ncbi:MAG: HPr family phosphocarrier protein [Chloroflexi bacterium]|nr:HPr family phosphocarrier protein [Chloroflexota bacterium]